MSAPIAIEDHVYDHIYTNLTQGHRYVMFQKHVMMVLRDGAMIGIIQGMQRPVVKLSTLLAEREMMPKKEFKVDFLKLKGSKEHSHAYLDEIVTLARAEGFPLANVHFSPLVHAQDVCEAAFNAVIDHYRTGVNTRRY